MSDRATRGAGAHSCGGLTAYSRMRLHPEEPFLASDGPWERAALIVNVTAGEQLVHVVS